MKFNVISYTDKCQVLFSADFLRKKMFYSPVLIILDIILSWLNHLTAAIRGSGYKLFVKWHHYPGARLERYLQNGAVIRMVGFTHRPLSKNRGKKFLIISMVLL